MLYIIALIALFVPAFVSAHEAYVLPYNTFWNGMGEAASGHAFAALENRHDLKITLIIVAATLIALVLNLLFRRTRLGARLHAWPERFSKYGTHFVRITLAVAFFFSAWSGSYLGPELHSDLFPHSGLLRIALFILAGMIALGVFTELAALASIGIFLYSLHVFGPYMLTYLNYFGEFVVLLLFGLRAFSLDRYLFGPVKRFRNFKKYETTIVRVFYGLALIYAAINVKLLHPAITLDVVNTWHLTRFHWLFPSDPLLVTLGAGVVETVIGLFILFGFEMRLTVLVSLFYITLSLLYFRELVWPHLLLYGISFNLIVQPENFTLDHLFFRRRDKKLLDSYANP
jgi:hypothetical protein